MATTRHTRSKPRRNPRRMTMAGVRAKSRAYARATYGHDGFFSAQNSRFFGPEKFDGPYSGPGGTFFTKTGRGGAGVYVVEDSGDVHTDWESDRRYPDMTRRLGVEVAKARAAGKPLTAAAVLRSAGVANASAVGARWLRMVQANIVEDMRSQKLPLLVHGWSDLERYTDPGRYLLTPTGEIPPGADEASDSSIELARRTITEEVDAWLQAEGHVQALKRLGKKAFRDNPRRGAAAARRSRVRPNGEHELVYVGSLDGKQRTVRPTTLVEHQGGDVEFYMADGFSHRIASRDVIAVDGVPRKRRASAEDAATLLTTTVPLPKTREHDEERGLDLYRTLRANRTLRDALEAAREDYERGRFFISRPGRRRQDLSLGPSDALDVGHDRLDARGGLHAKDQFARGIVWNAAQRNAVARDLFDAFVAWNLADPEGTYEGREQARVRRGIILSRSSFYAIAHDLYLRNGGSGYRTLTAPEWRWFGMDESHVEHGFFEAHSRGNVWYQAAGSVVELRFLREPQSTRSNPHGATTYGARRRTH